MTGPTQQLLPEDFSGVQELYDVGMADNVHLHDLIYEQVFGPDQYIGQFSDNSADELQLMGELMELPCSASVLDAGCGRGNVAEFLSHNLGWNVTGIDISAVSIGATQSRTSKTRFIQGNIYEYDFPGRFDGIYFTGAACHFNATSLLKRCASLLRPGGKVALFERVRRGVIPAKEWTFLTEHWKCPYVYSSDEYRDCFEAAGFNIRHSVDMTESFQVWQHRSVSVRDDLRDQIIAMSSEEYFQLSRNLADYENQATQRGLLGYALIVAELPA